MGIDAAFAKQIKLTLLDALQAEGFTRYRKYNVDWPLEKGFHCWVSLNTALYPDRVGLIPLVGVHVEPIERLSHTIQRRKYDRGIATYALNMGKIEAIADERAFAFAPEQSSDFIASEARRLAQLYVGAGLEFARSSASYEALLPLLRAWVPSLGGFPERVTCCLYLMGRREEARAFAEDFLSKETNYFCRFAVPFLKMIDAGKA